MPTPSHTIGKLHIINFLAGMVFWYGIEKLFLRSIGIGAGDIAWLLAIFTSLVLLLDIPAGLLADRWSRRGLLICSVTFMGLASIVMGTSYDFTHYLIGYIILALYMVCSSGTYHALVYDVAHTEGRAHLYSRIMGKAYALFLCGAGVANIASGLIGQVDLRVPFWLTLIPCAINILVILSITEPTFHKRAQQANLLAQFGRATKTIMQMVLLRSLVLIYAGFAVSEVFKQDYSQLYFLIFNNSAFWLGLFWAAYAFMWAIGNAIAYRLASQLHLLIIFSLSAPVILAVWHSPWALIIFMAQVITAAAAHILIETQLQNVTPSAVRASVLSVLGTSERLVRIPASLALGWLIAQLDMFTAIGVVASLSLIALIYWLLFGARHLKAIDNNPTPPRETLAQM